MTVNNRGMLPHTVFSDMSMGFFVAIKDRGLFFPLDTNIDAFIENGDIARNIMYRSVELLLYLQKKLQNSIVYYGMFFYCTYKNCYLLSLFSSLQFSTVHMTFG